MQANKCKRIDDDDGIDGGGVSLPEDIVMEVLLRLPAKSLRRFQSVCKRWRALISAPAFVAAQRSRAGTGPFVAAVFGSAPEQELRLLDKGGNVLMVFDDAIRGGGGGGGGRALLAPTRLDRIFVDRGKLGAAMIDPASGRHFTVVGTNDSAPPLPWWPPPTSSSSSCTVFADDYSFGRAAASGDYKVLRLATSQKWHFPHRWCEVATFTDTDGGGGGGAAGLTWRQRPRGPFLDSKFSCQDKVTVNGIVYFMPYNNDAWVYCRDRIAAFDLETEEWRPETIKWPLLERKEEGDRYVALTELKGTLCLVQNIRHRASLVGGGGHYVNIWLLMEEDPNKSVWVKEYTIQMPERLLLFTKPLDVLGDGTTLLLLNMSTKAGNDKSSFRYTLQFYNCSTEDFTDSMEMTLETFTGAMALYTGSLVS